MCAELNLLSFVFIGRCEGHPKAQEIAAWVQANQSGICTVLDGQGEGTDCPSSALKPKPAAKPPQPKSKEDDAADDNDQDEFPDLDEINKADGKAAAARVQPGRIRAKPDRLDSSPPKPKGKSKKVTVDVDADEAEVKPEVGVGRGQKPGPRGPGGEPMKYKKRADAGTAGAAGKRRRTAVKLEGEPRTLASHVSFIWIVFRRALTVCQLLTCACLCGGDVQ